jgi:hypothetical protein
MARREEKERVCEEWKKVLGAAALTSSRQDEAKRQSDKTKPKQSQSQSKEHLSFP